jgi:threonylcarbamoyladenosine tRNA methylthiotransferase MtaB
VKYAIHTFGCRANQADSLELEERLRARGAAGAPLDEADLVIVNTCTVTAAADQGARNLIRRIIRRNASARIVVTGCYATREPEALASLPGVVRLVPNAGKGALVDGAWPRHEDEGHCGTPLEPGVMGRTAFPLGVQTGCDEQCAFCVIPSTRGASRSRPAGEVLTDVGRLAAAGYKELWLVGVHLGSYGRDLVQRPSLLDLLRALDRAPGEVTIRISSLEPMDCTREIVGLVAGSGRFAPHFHLPLQHASDRLLRIMRRPYTLDRYRRLVDRIRERIPHAAVGSDLIVGFPGETEEDVEACARYLSGSPLTHVHVFPYSDRPGTAASAMAGRPTGADVRARGARLREVGVRLSHRFRQAQVGTVRPGLTLEDGSLVVTDNYLKVRIPAGRPSNERVRVHIDAAGPVVSGHVA